MTDRGVSETLGFVMVFAIVVSTVGVVYATGFSGLKSAKDAEQLTNMERAFDVLDDNVEDLGRRGAPSRATEIKLAGGSLGFGAPTTITVNASDTSNPSDYSVFSVQAEPVVYSREDTNITYAAGAVFRSDDGNSVMLSEPGWITESGRSHVSLVDTEGSDRSVGGRFTLLVVAKRDYNKFKGSFNASGGTVQVNVTVNSTRAAAWKGYFESRDLTAVDDDASDGEITYQFETDAIYVSETKVTVEFER